MESRSLALSALSVGVVGATLVCAGSAQAIMFPGDSGSGVAQLQEQLGIVADGVYGPATTSAVFNFQVRYGLGADGIAGPQTLSALGLPSNLGPGGGGEGPISGTATVTAASGLNVRSSPGGPVIGGLSFGQTVSLSGATSGGWVQLASGGWVSGAFLSTGGGGGELPVSGTATVTAASGLNVRSSPGGPVIGGLSFGQTVSLSGATSGGWVQLASGGWVSGAFLSTGGGGGEQPVGGGAVVNAGSGLLIRDVPAGIVVGSLGFGERVSLSGATQFAAGRTWAQLSSGGWVAQDFLTYL